MFLAPDDIIFYDEMEIIISEVNCGIVHIRNHIYGFCLYILGSTVTHRAVGGYLCVISKCNMAIG